LSEEDSANKDGGGLIDNYESVMSSEVSRLLKIESRRRET
jgi:hypothetical protein